MKELEQVLPYNKSLFDAKEYFKRVLHSLSVILIVQLITHVLLTLCVIVDKKR